MAIRSFWVGLEEAGLLVQLFKVSSLAFELASVDLLIG